jgi:hypothetical protein
MELGLLVIMVTNIHLASAGFLMGERDHSVAVTASKRRSYCQTFFFFFPLPPSCLD